jgi:lipoate-protein ligase A
VGRTLNAALASLGVPVRLTGPRTAVHPAAQGACFARPSRHEILVRDRKLVGSAQVRRRRGVLQHGSLPLTVDHARHRRATASPCALPMISLDEAAGRPVARDEVEEALIAAFASLAPRGLEAGALDHAEREAIRRLRADRYLDDRWTLAPTTPARCSA